MDEQKAWQRLSSARVGTLATIGDGRPHLVPITFAVVEQTVVTAVDHKRKGTRRLRRLRNIEATGVASILVHEYADDWDELWWVRVDGPATVHPTFDSLPGALEALAAKYHPYREFPPPGPVIEIAPDTVRWWTAAG